MNFLKSNRHSIFRACCVALFLFAFGWRAQSAAIADEVDFLLPLEKWVAGSPNVQGLWHSPLYPWLIMILGKLFGLTPLVVRSIGAFSLLGSAVLVADAFRRINPDRVLVSLVFALSLFSPACFGASLLADYDTTLLVFATALYFWAICLFANKLSLKWFFIFAVLLAFALLAKETTPLVYPVAFLAVAWSKRQPLRSLLYVVASSAVGVLLFLLTAFVWCRWYGLPFQQVFAMDLLGLANHGGNSDPTAKFNFLTRIWIKISPLIWIGLPAVYLFFTKKSSRARPVFAIALAVLATLFCYTFVLRQMTYHFPKYMAPVVPWLYWVIFSGVSSQKLRSFFDWKKAENRPIVILIFVTLIYFLAIPDVLDVLYVRNTKSVLHFLFIVSLPFCFRYFAAFFNDRRADLAAFIVVLMVGSSLNFMRGVFFTTRSVTYWYGETALSEAVQVVAAWRAKHPKGDILIPTKDLAYATRQYGTVYHSKEQLHSMTPLLCLQSKTLSSNRPLLVVTRQREDSALLYSPDLIDLKKCLPNVRQGVDIVFASSYSGT